MKENNRAITPEDIFEKMAKRKEPWRVVTGTRTLVDYYKSPIFVFIQFVSYALIIQQTKRTLVAYEVFKDGNSPVLRIFSLDVTEAWAKYNEYLKAGLYYSEPSPEERDKFRLDLTVKSL
jgi:hypothetical protein